MVHSGRKAATAAAALNKFLLVVVIGSEYNHKGAKNTKKHKRGRPARRQRTTLRLVTFVPFASLW
jgi:hypothetical protein